MSDTPQGPGWWQASDGKWYPPEQAPGGSSFTGGAVTLDTGAALSYGWNKFVQYIGQIIVIVLIILVVQAVFNVVGQILYGRGNAAGWILGLLVTIVGVVISYVLQAGIIRIGLAVTRGETPEPGMLFKTDNLGSYIIASILVGILIFVGLILCCIPGLIAAFFTYFFGFFVIDRGNAPVDAIKNSIALVRGNMGQVLVLMIVVVVLNLVTCGLATGVTLIALAYAYRVLNGEAVAP